MDVAKLEQGTPEWHAARSGKITASMVGGILGISPFITPEDAKRALVRSMIGAEPEFTGNYVTEWGNANEATARAMYELETTHTVEQVGFIPHPTESWAGCSPDGLVNSKGGVELKCPYSMRKGGKFKPLDEQPHYMAQVQFSLWVTGRKWWHFFAWCPTGTYGPIAVYPDLDWQNETIPVLWAFHAECLKEARDNPEEYLSPKRAVIDTPAAHTMMQEWDDIREQEAMLAERKKDLLAAIVQQAGERDTLFAGRKLTKVEKEGAVSYAKVVKEHLPDLDLSAYRGKASSFWKLT